MIQNYYARLSAFKPNPFKKVLLRMKMTILILTCILLRVNATVKAQNLSLTVKNESLENVIQFLKSYKIYNFYYDDALLKLAQPITVSLKNKPIDAVIAACFKDQPFTYVLHDKTVVLTLKTTNAPELNKSSMQQTVVKGLVEDGKGTGIPGVSVRVKGKDLGTLTNADGQYSLAVPSLDVTLVFSYVGFTTQEAAVNNRSQINITLADASEGLDEVVVVGYGTVRKSDLTGSVTSLKASELTKGANVNVQQSLIGRSSGVQIYQKSGEPGSAMSVQIRGVTSITGNNDPLYVIDGLPVNDQVAVGSTAPGGTTNNPNLRSAMNSLNPADIASIEILKDASATAIYGSRGANGVVIITTKKGSSGALKVEYNASFGTQKAARVLDYMNGAEYTQAINGIIDLGALTTQRVTGDNANTDWQSLLLKRAIIQTHDLSFSGGGGNTKFFISAGYFNQDGIMLKSGSKRYNARVNVENAVAEKYAVGISFSTSYGRDYYNATGVGLNDNASALYMAQNYDPTAPAYNADGSYFRSPLMNPMDNPVAVINGQYGQGDTYRTVGNIYAEYFLMPSLSAKVRVGADLNNTERYFWIDPSTLTGASYNGYADVRDGKLGYYLGEATLNFNKTINDHRISAVAGATYERYTSNFLTGNSRSFALPDLTFNGLGTGDNTLNGTSNGRQENMLVSFLGRVNYSYKGKYLVTGSLRADGSARFGPNQRFGYFPSAALAWRAHDEDFLKDSKVFSDLKLRASYGATGNQPNANYIYFSTYSAGRNAIFGGVRNSSLNPSRSANLDLKWESAKQADLGLDFGFLNSRLTGSIEYYNRKTSDLIYDVPQAASTGFGSKTENVGSMRNTGMEFSLKGSIIKKEDFSVDAGFNLTTLKNRVLSLGGLNQVVYGAAGSISSIGVLRPGESIGSYYGYVVQGVWQTGDDFSTAQAGVRPGDLKYQDLDGNKQINASDRKIIGKSMPDFYYGFNGSVAYKMVNLDVFFEGSQGAKLLNSSLVDAFYPVDLRRNKLAEPYLNRWTPSNPTNEYPSFLPNDVQGQRQINTRTVEDAAYLRLQSVRLSAKLPLPKNKFISNASLFVNGQNLYTWTKYTGSDPAANSLGDNILRVDYNSYPLTRTYTLGLNVQF
jgi:TonB-linked SusC/RagA family outer membrane protein